MNQLEKNHEFYDIIDIGGESTRPGSIEIDQNEELERVLPLLRMIKDNKTLKNKIISIDTRKAFDIAKLEFSCRNCVERRS